MDFAHPSPESEDAPRGVTLSDIWNFDNNVIKFITTSIEYYDPFNEKAVMRDFLA